MVVLKCKMCGGDIQVDAEPHWGATLSRYGVEFEKAGKYFDRALDADPECARAYMGKYLIENKFKTESDIVQSFVEHFKAKVEDLLQKSPGRFERTVFVTPDEASQQAVDALKN
ncbi:MAG: hypothetical protein LBQ42_07585, partial [Synergistaceae bacterium]|nr:hypothetical protein [Synergistaceae bacterium]